VSDAGRVALTFDDGPARWTEPILAVLAEHGARATFFVIGSMAERDPDLVRRAAAEGHEVGNHTWSHPALARECDDARVRDELARTNDVLESILGVRPRRFRAPFYDVDERVEAVAATLGLVHTRGDLRPPDWHERATAALTIAFVLRQVGPDTVVGLHDGIPPSELELGGTRRPTVDAVAAMVPRLVQAGYELVTASELLAAEQAA
jgi:peptidoglycan/xylan/chitin deacetylase (PgdA/CDA1 family)